jgi:glycosyltransferase involved in cell wall biosynthesis
VFCAKLIDMSDVEIIVPVYNEEDSIELFVSEIINWKEKLPDSVNLKILFIDDGSTDSTWQNIDQCNESFKKLIEISGIRFTRNYGKESALFAGIVFSTADALIPMDVDLQDPPELIPGFVEAWMNGARMVVAVRTQRNGDGFFKRKSAEFFYKVYNSISDIEIPENVGDFRIIDKSIVNDISRLNESNKFMKGIFSYVAKPDGQVSFIRSNGLRSESNPPTQSFRKLLDLAEIALTGAGPKLFRKLLGLLVFFDIALILYATYILGTKFFSGVPFEGFTSIILLVAVTSSAQLTLLAIFGVILSRVYLESKNRPSYFIRDTINSK